MNKTGFGFLRLPKTPEGEIDYPFLNTLVDRFLAMGGRYFDTAYTYLNGMSEVALRKCLVERYPRDSFLLADKLPGYKVKEPGDCQAYFDEQLQRCGVTYFDVYMLHWLDKKHYAIAQQFDEFAFLRQLKAQGKAKRIGFSFHDSPELLDQILTEHPEVDLVLLQMNYLDWSSHSLRAAQLYAVAVSHGKQVVVMEPVKGGALANLPEQAQQLLQQRKPNTSAASWAICFAASLEHVQVVLSGMNTMEQVEDNLQPMEPLTQEEKALLEQCAQIIRGKTAIGCTGCGYCLEHCPVGMPINRFFSIFNDQARDPSDAWKMQPGYDFLANQHVGASACLGCGQCEKNCPQGLPIIAGLAQVAEIFEKEDPQ